MKALRSFIVLTHSGIRLATSDIRFASGIMLRIVILCFAQLGQGRDICFCVARRKKRSSSFELLLISNSD